jgi:hypothetical protein
MNRLRLAACLFAMLFVCGCGSSGTSSNQTPVGTPVSLTTFNGLYAGTAKVAGSQISFNNMSGIDTQGTRWSGSYTLVSDGPTIFDNLSTTRSSTSFTLQSASTVPVTIAAQRYFLVSNGALYKITNVPGTITYIPSISALPPDPANVGDFGTIAILSGSDGSTLSITWQLRPEFHGNSLMIITSTTRNILNVVTSTEIDTYFLDRAGTPFKLGVSLTTNGTTVTLTGNKT